MGNASCCVDKKTSRHTSIQINLNISTWSRTHNLFNHSNHELKSYYSFSTNQDTIFLRQQDQWKAITSMEQLQDKTKIQSYFDVTKQEKNITLFNNVINDDGLRDGAIWKVAQDDQQLGVNDVFKLGRFRFKIIHLVTDSAPFEDKIAIQRDYACKICYDKTQSDNNPLLSPCACSGSMKYIHLECLKHWVTQICKIVSKDNVTKISSKEACCKLCGERYNLIIQKNNRKYNILDQNFTVQRPYIQIDLLSKSCNLISFNNKKNIKIGRGILCQIKPNQDTSISRIHAELGIEGQKLYIRDCKSKFGTLKLITDPEQISDFPCSRRYQITNSLIQLQAKYCQVIVNPEEYNANQDKTTRKNSIRKNRRANNQMDYLPIEAYIPVEAIPMSEIPF